MSLDFVGSWDLNIFKDKCSDQRDYARDNPVTSKSAKRLTRYRWRVGPWYLCFTLETWAKPVWHGSVIAFREDYKTIDYRRYIEVARDVPHFTDEWGPDDFSQARYLLSEMFGPLVRPGRDQRALETTALMGLHWHVDYDASNSFLKDSTTTN